MKRVTFKKTAAIVLALVLALSMFAGCGKTQDADMTAVVDAAVKAALEAATVPTNITIEVDGQRIIIEDAANVSLQDLLAQANITLNEGDYLTVAPYQAMSGNITVQVLRTYTVTVVLTAEDPADEVRHSTVLFEGTVADALAAVGVELAENQTIDAELDQPLENGMVISVFTEVIEETEPEETEPEETEPEATVPPTTAPSNSGGSSSTPKPTTPKETKPKETKPKETTKPTEAPKPTETTPPETTKPAETKPAKTVVSVEYYEDCDGSGHGVKVITYSDGSQEEVPY